MLRRRRAKSGYLCGAPCLLGPCAQQQRYATALRDSVLCLPTDSHSLLVNELPSSDLTRARQRAAVSVVAENYTTLHSRQLHAHGNYTHGNYCIFDPNNLYE